MPPRITLKDVAKEAGVSVITASRAIRGIGRVNVETRRRILETATILGYKRHTGQVFHSLGQASPSDHSLRVLLPIFRTKKQQANYIFGTRLIEGIRDMLTQNGGQLITVEADDINDLNSKLPRARVHGIVVRQPLPDKWLRKLQAIAPVVYAISFDAPLNVDCVYFNEFKAAAVIYDNLLSRGHRNIAWISMDRSNPMLSIDRSQFNNTSSYDRQAHNFLYGRYGAWKALDMGVRDRSVKHNHILLPLPLDSTDTELDPEQAGKDAAKAILDLEERPTAVVISSDDVALYAQQELIKAGISIPEDLSLVTYMASKIGLTSKARISGIHLPFGQVGRIIPEIIQRRVTNPDSVCISVMLESELLDRGTIANAPTANSSSL